MKLQMPTATSELEHTEGALMAICYHCGKKIEGEGVPYSVGGNPVSLHKGCRRWYRTKPLTANVPDEQWQDVDGDDDAHR